jgi:hypothetical protein
VLHGVRTPAGGAAVGRLLGSLPIPRFLQRTS